MNSKLEKFDSYEFEVVYLFPFHIFVNLLQLLLKSCFIAGNRNFIQITKSVIPKNIRHVINQLDHQTN